MFTGRFITCVGLSITIIGCSVNPYLDDYLDSIEVPDEYIFFTHDEYGLKSNIQEPLKAQFERCNQEVLQSQSIRLGEYELSEIKTLEVINQDYHAFLMESVLTSGSGDSDAIKALLKKSRKTNDNAELSSEAFLYTEGLEGALKKLTRLVVKRNRCLSNTGWIYKGVR